MPKYNVYVTLCDPRNANRTEFEIPLRDNPFNARSVVDCVLFFRENDVYFQPTAVNDCKVVGMRVEENTGRKYRCKTPNADIGVGETAIGRFLGGQFIVQADSLAHDWSHGWHLTDWKLWEVCNG